MDEHSLESSFSSEGRIGQEQKNPQITESVLNSLSATKPWVRFFSILGFISIVLMFFSTAMMAVGMKSLPVSPGASKASLGFIAVFNSAMIIICFFPSYFLFQYASAIGKLLHGGGVSELEDALQFQKLFWRFAGIMAVLTFVLGIGAAIVIPQLISLSSLSI